MKIGVLLAFILWEKSRFMKSKIPYVIVKEGKWFTIRSLTVPVTTQGKTEEEAIKMLEEAAELYLESTNEDVQEVNSLHYGWIDVDVRKKTIA